MGPKQLNKLKELNLGGAKKQLDTIKDENEEEVPDLVNFEEVSKQD